MYAIRSYYEYRKSRGLIALDLIASKDILKTWQITDLTDIEPFTIVFFNGNELYQLQWDEFEKSTQNLDRNNFV